MYEEFSRLASSDVFSIFNQSKNLTLRKSSAEDGEL